MNQHEKQFESNELSLENKSLVDQIKALKAALDQERTDSKQQRAKVEADKAALLKELGLIKKELEATKTQYSAL